MIKTILEILALEGFECASKEIYIAKGKYKLKTDLKGIYNDKKIKQWLLKK